MSIELLQLNPIRGEVPSSRAKSLAPISVHKRSVRIVVADEDRDLELDVDAQPVEQVAEQDRARVDVEHLAHAVVGVVVEVLVEPLQRVLVGLTDAAEVAGDRFRTAQVDVRAVGALGVEGLDDSWRR